MIRVYTASKLKHAPAWRKMCAENGHVQFHARWLKHNLMGTPDTPAHAAEFWAQDEQDVRDADAVLVYGEGEDHLRGALVEAGIAIACGVPVIVVGTHADYGTWQYHPGVTRMPDMVAALAYLREIKPRYHMRNVPGGAVRCSRSTVAGRPYCAQHDKMAAARVEAGRNVISKLKKD